MGNFQQPKSRTLQGTNISPKNGILKMIFLFPRWDMLIPWRVPSDDSRLFWLAEQQTANRFTRLTFPRECHECRFRREIDRSRVPVVAFLVGVFCSVYNWLVATQRFFIFTPKIGEDEPILTSIFFKGVETTN